MVKEVCSDTWLSLQFADGVYLVLLMGLLEGYFVPLHSFFLTPDSFEQKVRGMGLGETHSPHLAYLYWACLGRDRSCLLTRPLLVGDGASLIIPGLGMNQPPAASRNAEHCSLPFGCPCFPSLVLLQTHSCPCYVRGSMAGSPSARQP